ncbi:hypothetical protein PVAP13_7KG127455 [Panicum virgatum]|uniref:Uncharacterized protein n=1 Tax=Panicum virgatum TaxID=38727 RepID=A0A8T0QDH1_PANVG|nr:hypothetical protein PVAP13_7KG127455 [Panicum virgatum]
MRTLFPPLPPVLGLAQVRRRVPPSPLPPPRWERCHFLRPPALHPSGRAHSSSPALPGSSSSPANPSASTASTLCHPVRLPLPHSSASVASAAIPMRRRIPACVTRSGPHLESVLREDPGAAPPTSAQRVF